MMHAHWQEVFDFDKLTFVYPEEFVRLEDEKGESLGIYAMFSRCYSLYPRARVGKGCNTGRWSSRRSRAIEFHEGIAVPTVRIDSPRRRY
jgi:hypothetical protein